jgi:hypothetical protein
VTTRTSPSDDGCPLVGVPGLSGVGLDGTGEIVSVGDTGLDFTSCFFFDKAHNVSAVANPFVNLSPAHSHHRKLAGYWSLMDSQDKDGGHGTHVSGSVAGDASPAWSSRVCSEAMLSRYNGMAPKAKLFFVDLQCNTPEGCSCGTEAWCPCAHKRGGVCPADGFLYPPDDLRAHYLAPVYDAGARINTNSWGSDCSTGSWCATTTLERGTSTHLSLSMTTCSCCSLRATTATRY